jgi:ATP phosphoribosyltransferase
MVLLRCRVIRDDGQCDLSGVCAVLATAGLMPSYSSLYGDAGYAVTTEVAADQVAELVPKLKKAGATGIAIVSVSGWWP